MNSYTHEIIYSFHKSIHMYMNSYNHFYTNSYNDYMNSSVYEFIYMNSYNSYMNSYRLWIHVNFFIYELICIMNSYMNLSVPTFQMLFLIPGWYWCSVGILYLSSFCSFGKSHVVILEQTSARNTPNDQTVMVACCLQPVWFLLVEGPAAGVLSQGLHCSGHGSGAMCRCCTRWNLN